MKQFISILFFIIIINSVKLFGQNVEVSEIKENKISENINNVEVKKSTTIENKEVYNQNPVQKNNIQSSEENHKELPIKKVAEKNTEIVKIQSVRKGLEDEK